MTRIVAVTVLMAAVANAGDAVASRSVEPRRAFLVPAQILKRLEASPVEVKLAGIEALQDVARGRLADETWPELVPPIEHPKVRRKNGNITVEPWARPKAVEAPMEKGETAFQQKDYLEAAKWYRKALEIAPDFYIARAYLGDTHLFGGKGPKAALEEYDQAIARNPDDYRLYFFRANAHRQLDDLQSMQADLRRSLVLKPRNPILLGAMERARGLMGRAEPEVFIPRGFVRRGEGNVVEVYADIDRPEWLAWANCKALWMIDGAHRKEMVGSTEHGWSTAEELECLGSLMGVYEARKRSGGAADDRLEVLGQIIHDGLSPAFVIYEFGSRVDPQIVLRLDDRFREMMARYVEKYVLPPSE
jgi:tetratricopeptide (TPR) repeat protein